MRFPALAAAWSALFAGLVPVQAPAQDDMASPETLTVSGALDLRQVDFRLVRVASEQEFSQDPDSHELLEVKTIEGEPFSLPVDPHPLLHITQLESAVIRQDRYGLHHLDLRFEPEDREAYAGLTAANAGERVLWLSHDDVLADLFFTGRDESGGFSIFYGDTPLDSVEAVLQLLQIDYTVEFAEDLIVPATHADELRLEAMRELRLRPNAEGKRRATSLLTQALESGGSDYEFRPRILFVIASLQLELGQTQEAVRNYLLLMAEDPDFEDTVEVLRALRAVAAGQRDEAKVLTLSRAIVEREGGRGPEAIEAQSVVCNLLLRRDPRPPEFEAEARRMVSMLRDHMTTLPRGQRHDVVLRVIGYLAEIGAVDEIMRTARARLADLPRDPFTATTQVTSMARVMALNGLAPEGMTMLQEYAETFRESHDVEDPQSKPFWEHIQRTIDDIEGMAELPQAVPQ